MKQVMVLLLFILGLPVAVLADLSSAAHAEAGVPAGLPADDECAADAGAGGCSLSALQRRGQRASSEAAAPLAAASSEDAGESGNLGVVSEMYTFGAPGTSSIPFTDLNRHDGIFRGLRCYTENFLGVNDESKQIDGGALFGPYKHPWMATVVLHWGRDSYYVPGGGRPDWPLAGALVYTDWGLHHRRHYVDRLSHVRVKGRVVSRHRPFAKALLMSYLSFEAYNTPDKFKEIVHSKLSGHRLVAHEVQFTLEAKDAVWLVQNSQDKGCTLVFTGTSNPSELGTSIKSYTTGYCGYTDVHSGYRDKLYWITKGLWWKIGPKLGKCSRVTCAGHSLGGSLCDIFSACANSRRTYDVDFRQQMWIQRKPELMPEV